MLFDALPRCGAPLAIWGKFTISKPVHSRYNPQNKLRMDHIEHDKGLIVIGDPGAGVSRVAQIIAAHYKLSPILLVDTENNKEPVCSVEIVQPGMYEQLIKMCSDMEVKAAKDRKFNEPIIIQAPELWPEYKSTGIDNRAGRRKKVKKRCKRKKK